MDGGTFVNHGDEVDVVAPPSQPPLWMRLVVAFVVVSFFAALLFLWRSPEKSVANVAAYAWITTASTGLGAAPFYCFTSLRSTWLGVSNAVAGGMMTAASIGLIIEAMEDEALIAALPGHEHNHGALKVVLGLAVGGAFMLLSKRYLDGMDHLDIGNLHGASARRALLIIAVMTLHSFAEGLVRGLVWCGVVWCGVVARCFVFLCARAYACGEGWCGRCGCGWWQ